MRQAIAQLKVQPGKDMAMFSSSDPAAGLFPATLIAEYRISLNPVVLGVGKPLFKGIHDRYHLSLRKATASCSGIVLLCYHPVGA
jgi:dihydrofolate reductase